MTTFPLCSPLLIDMGIPVIAFTLPAMIVLLIPVIAIEGYLCKKWLQLSWWRALKSNAASNLTSTLIGIPVTWAIMFGVELASGTLLIKANLLEKWNSPVAHVVAVLFFSAWIGPTESDTLWMVPTATLGLLIPFFFASYGIEYLVMRNMVGMPEGGPPNLAYPRVRIAVRNANLVTYGLMFLATSVWLIFTLPHR